ncbi:MAG: asparagine synthase (glutamine-hydrolyzing), partial [Cyclobacteriaceae bacterium]|nr:asparagine synthase (glutamine-hydrolyzing) [Cyclobacteriaceae bacterium]
FGYWIKKPEHAGMINNMTRETLLIYEFVDRKKILDLIQDHLSGRDDNSQEIWSLFVISAWIEQHFN